MTVHPACHSTQDLLCFKLDAGTQCLSDAQYVYESDPVAAGQVAKLCDAVQDGGAPSSPVSLCSVVATQQCPQAGD